MKESLLVPSPVRLGLVLVGLIAWPGGAAAAGHVCQRVATGTIEVDGMIDDWRGFRGRDAGSGGDHAFALRCAYDDANLYVALDVADDRVIRTGRGKRQDRVSVSLRAPGGRAVSVRAFPGTRGFEPKVSKPRWIDVADSLQPAGFSIELGVPLRKLDAWSRTVPVLVADFRFSDVDSTSRGRDGSARFNGRLHFSGAVAVYRQFLKSAGLRGVRARLDTYADVDLGDGAERIISAGAVIGVLSDRFTFMKLPVASPADVLSVRVVRFGGGRSQILAHYRQRGNGSREIVAVWQVGATRFEKLLAVEVKKELGNRSITNRWSLEPAGKYRRLRRGQRARGHDLVIEAGEAIGFDKDNYRESRATDAVPILLPWAEQTSAVYYLEGGRLTGGEPMSRRRRGR